MVSDGGDLSVSEAQDMRGGRPSSRSVYRAWDMSPARARSGDVCAGVDDFSAEEPDRRRASRPSRV